MSRFCNDFGENLREARTFRGITQEQLAEAVSERLEKPISGKTVSAWERGTRAPSIDQAYHVAEVLQTSAAILLGSRNDNADQKRMREKFKAVVATLPYDEKRMLYHIIVEWDGDHRALLELMYLYTELPDEDRYYLIGDIVGLYRATHAENAQEIDLRRILTQWHKLHP